VNNATASNPRRIAAALAIAVVGLTAGCTGTGSDATGAGSPTTAATAGGTTASPPRLRRRQARHRYPWLFPGQPGKVELTVRPPSAFVPSRDSNPVPWGSTWRWLIGQFHLIDCNSI
jgi:hypothetical protein